MGGMLSSRYLLVDGLGLDRRPALSAGEDAGREVLAPVRNRVTGEGST
jgi:hypothetical protein